MNSDDLALLLLVANTGSVSAAAVQGGLDASTLSRRVSQLEKTLNTRLFTRSGRGMTPTAQGQVLLEHARQIASLMKSAQAAMGQTQAGPARIHIAAQPTLAKMLFGRLFHAIRARYPATQIRFTESLADRILSDLQSGEVDIALLYRPEQAGSLSYEPLLMERLCLLTPLDSDVTATQLENQGLAGVPLILPSTRHGIRVLVQAMAARRQQEPCIVLESDSAISLTVDLVRQGCGCTVLPLAAAEADIRAGRLRALPLPGSDGERCVSLVMGRTATAATDLWRLNSLIRELALGLAGTPDWPGTRALPGAVGTTAPAADLPVLSPSAGAPSA